MNDNKERWINIEEVAEYIGVSPVTIRYWLRSGKNLPGRRGGDSGASGSKILMSGSNQEKAVLMIECFFLFFHVQEGSACERAGPSCA